MSGLYIEQGTMSYFKDISYFGNIEKETQLKMGELMASEELPETEKALLKEELIKSHLRLVSNIAHRYKSFAREKNINIDLDDLVQEGNMGLIMAVDKWDYKKGCAFSTYATFWIEKYIKSYLQIDIKKFAIPRSYVDLINKRNAIIETLTDERGVAPDDEEVRNIMGLKKVKYKTIKDASEVIKQPYYIDDILENNVYGEANLFQTDDVVLNSILEEDSTNSLMYLLSDLTKEQRDCLIYRYGLDGSEQRPYRAVAKITGIDHRRLARIEAEALTIIKRKVAEEGFSIGDFF